MKDPEAVIAILVQALRYGVRYFEGSVRSGPVPPEIQAMRGAIQQYERARREAQEALVVPVTARVVEEPRP